MWLRVENKSIQVGAGSPILSVSSNQDEVHLCEYSGQNKPQDFEVAVEKEVKLASVVNENNVVDVPEPKHLLFNESIINENVIPSCASEAVGSHTDVSKELNSPVFDGVNIVSDQAKVEAQACDLSPQVCF